MTSFSDRPVAPLTQLGPRTVRLIKKQLDKTDAHGIQMRIPMLRDIPNIVTEKDLADAQPSAAPDPGDQEADDAEPK